MKTHSLIIFFLCYTCALSLSSVEKIIPASSQYEIVGENGLPIVTRDLPVLNAALESIKNNACRNDARFVIEGIQNLTSWAVKFYDASGKFPEGVLAGSTYDLGNFDECLNIGKYDTSGLNGKYCLGRVDASVPEDFKMQPGSIWENFAKREKRYQDVIERLHWGICVPASCGSDDVQEVVRTILELAFGGTQLSLHVTVDEKKCYTRQLPEVDRLDIAYVTTIGVITLIIIVGTIFHMIYLKYNKSTSGTMAQILIAFSIISNMKKLCGPANDDGMNLHCISGMKFIAMCVIIAGHCLVFIVGGPVLNSNFWSEAVTKIENAIFLNNPLLVDTFLLLGGFLFARILLKELDKRRTVNFLFLYILRYIRLTPAYLVIVGLYVTWLPRLDSGPLWYRMVEERERCRESWWTNILYVNNYVKTDKLCMFQSWYLSVDTQLFIMAPAIIYPLWKWRKTGEFILASATVISMIIPFTVTLVNHLDPTLMAYRGEIEDLSSNEYFLSSYVKTHMRANAYFFGLIYGYILYRIQSADYKLTKNCVTICWILASLALVVSMFSIALFYGPRKDFDVVESAIYSAMHRVLWSLGSGWVLIACVTDNSGPVKNFLKWRPFVPLSRLTYSAYLVNGLVELHGISTTRTPQHLDNISLLAKVLSHIMLTFLGAVVVSTMFESPILGLERIFLRPAMQKSTKSEESISRNSSEETASSVA